MLRRELLGCQVFRDTEVRAGWRLEPLRQHIELAYGFALQDERRNSGPVRVFGSNGQVGWHDEIGVPGPGILVGRKGTVGAVHFSVGDFWPIDTVYYVKLLKEHDLRFVYHLLSYLPLNILNAATGVPGLSRRDAYALLAPFPSPEGQAAIARILDAVDTTIERTQDAIHRARDLKVAVVQDFFFAALGETAYADRPSRKLPEGWRLDPTDVMLLQDPKNGISPSTNTQPPGIPTFSIGAIRGGCVSLDDPDLIKYAQITEAAAQAYLIKRGDILIVRGNANPDLVGKCGIVDKFPAGCIYPDITMRVMFRSKGPHAVSPDYAALAWNHPIVHNQILRRAKTSNGTLKINSRDVKQIILPLPPMQDQERIAELTGAVSRKIEALRSVENAYAELKKSLMHDLFTGKVRTDRVELNEVAA